MQHDLMAWHRSTTVGAMPVVLTMGLHVVCARVVVNGLLSEAQHAIGECINVRRVLTILADTEHTHAKHTTDLVQLI